MQASVQGAAVMRSKQLLSVCRCGEQLPWVTVPGGCKQLYGIPLTSAIEGNPEVLERARAIQWRSGCIPHGQAPPDRA
jgi:hypothetical protein